MTTKFTWEPSTGGSLLLRLQDGDRETTWKIRKAAKPVDLYSIFSEISQLIDDGMYPVKSERKPLGYVGDIAVYDYDEMVNLDPETEEASMANLAAKADSVKLSSGEWWLGNDMDELDLYELGTGEPE